MTQANANKSLNKDYKPYTNTRFNYVKHRFPGVSFCDFNLPVKSISIVMLCYFLCYNLLLILHISKKVINL